MIPALLTQKWQYSIPLWNLPLQAFMAASSHNPEPLNPVAINLDTQPIQKGFYFANGTTSLKADRRTCLFLCRRCSLGGNPMITSQSCKYV